MADIIVRAATREDIARFAVKMRPEDIEEAWTLCRLSGYEGLMQSYEVSKECQIGVLDGKIFCIYGCTPGGDEASIWMMFVKDIQALPMSFFRKSREYLQNMLKTYGRIGNYVRPENTFILKWLTWLGFTIEPLEQIGVDNIWAHRFWKENKNPS